MVRNLSQKAQTFCPCVEILKSQISLKPYCWLCWLSIHIYIYKYIYIKKNISINCQRQCSKKLQDVWPHPLEFWNMCSFSFFFLVFVSWPTILGASADLAHGVRWQATDATFADDGTFSSETDGCIVLYLTVCLICVNTDCVATAGDVEQSCPNCEVDVEALRSVAKCVERLCQREGSEIWDLRLCACCLWLILHQSSNKKRLIVAWQFFKIDFPEFQSTLLSTLSQTALKNWHPLTLNATFSAACYFLFPTAH